MTPRVRRRVLTSAVAAVLLAAVTGWCLQRGVVTRPSTGGLLVEPVPLTRLVGVWLALATLTGTAALLAAADAVALILAARAGRRGARRGHPGPGTLDG